MAAPSVTRFSRTGDRPTSPSEQLHHEVQAAEPREVRPKDQEASGYREIMDMTAAAEYLGVSRSHFRIFWAAKFPAFWQSQMFVRVAGL
jgi:hypothetical protein